MRLNRSVHPAPKARVIGRVNTTFTVQRLQNEHSSRTSSFYSVKVYASSPARDRLRNSPPSGREIGTGNHRPMYKESTGAQVWTGQTVAHTSQRVVAVFAFHSQ